MNGQDKPGRRTLVVGVGNEFRRDDGAGPAVIARLRALQPDEASLAGVTLALSDGEPGRLIDLWEGTSLAVVIDAVRDSARPAGHTCQLAPGALAGRAAGGAASSHGIGLGGAVELARALGRLPARLAVLAVVGRDFGFGTGLTAEVAAAVEEVAGLVREIVRCPPQESIEVNESPRSVQEKDLRSSAERTAISPLRARDLSPAGLAHSSLCQRARVLWTRDRDEIHGGGTDEDVVHTRVRGGGYGGKRGVAGGQGRHPAPLADAQHVRSS